MSESINNIGDWERALKLAVAALKEIQVYGSIGSTMLCQHEADTALEQIESLNLPWTQNGSEETKSDFRVTILTDH